MPLRTPEDLAKLLQLVPGIVDTRSYLALSNETCSEVWNLYMELAGTTLETVGIFVAEFNATYLPSYIQRMLSPDDDSVSFLRSEWLVLVLWLAYVARCDPPSFGRFLREHEGQARELYVLLAKCVSELQDPIIQDPGCVPYIQNLILSVAGVSLALLYQLPSLDQMPLLHPFTRFGLARVLPLLKAVPRFAEGKKMFSTLEVAEGALAQLWDDSDLREKEFGSQEVFAWWRCEIPLSETTYFECSELSKGAEMQACSRCRAVRYCSRDHQRADWKRHKLTCFEPRW